MEGFNHKNLKFMGDEEQYQVKNLERVSNCGKLG
jgi:hypothetical protein